MGEQMCDDEGCPHYDILHGHKSPAYFIVKSHGKEFTCCSDNIIAFETRQDASDALATDGGDEIIELFTKAGHAS